MKHIFSIFLFLAMLVLTGCNLEVIEPTVPPVTFQTRIQGAGGQVAAGYDVIQSKDSGYVVFGWTQNSGGNSDFYLLKFDRKGVQQWAKSFGSGGYDFAYSGAQASDGGYVFSGESDGKFYVVKVDASGNQQWAYTGDNGGYAISMVINSDGSILAAGNIFGGTANLSDIILVKLSSGGSLLWNRRINTNASESVQQIIVEPGGGYMIGGITGDGLNFDGLLMKVDVNGSEVWRKAFNGAGNGFDEINSLAKTTDGGYILGGRTDATSSNSDFYVLKTDVNGIISWQKTWGDTGFDKGDRILQNSDGSYTFLGDASFSSYPIVYLTRLTANGDQTWIHTFDVSENDDFGYGMRQTLDKGYIITGATYQTTGTNVLLIKTDENGEL